MEPLTRIAEIEVYPDKLDAYRAALQEGIVAAIGREPGVLMLYAVSVKDNPTQIRIFERYVSQQAYEAHVQSPHFRKYKSTVGPMVKSLRLIEAETILLGAKPMVP